MSAESPLETNTGNVTGQSWIRILVLGILCSIMGAWWEQQSQVINGTIHVAEAVPPLSGIASLLFLIVLGPLIGRFGVRFGFSRQEILMTYAFVCISVSVGFIGLYKQVFRLLTSPLYMHDRTVAETITPYLPDWLVVKDPEAIRTFWEGLKGAPLPWGLWMKPLICIGGIFVLFYFTTSLLIGFFFRRWSQDERLSFPVAELAIELVGERHASGAAALFKDSAFLTGVGLATAFNLWYIIPTLIPLWEMPPDQVPFDFLWSEPPWTAGGYGPIFRFNPVVIGLGFLVPTNVLLTIWVTLVVVKLEAVIASWMGVPTGPMFHIYEQQGIGGYISFFLVMCWAVRRYAWEAFQQFWKSNKVEDNAPGKFTVIGLFAGTFGMLAILMGAGMAFWFAAIFFALLMIRVLVTARIRAQAGIANIYVHIIDMRSFIYLLGGASFASAGSPTIAALVFMSFLISCTYITPYQLDGFRLAEVTGFGYRRWIWLSFLAIVCGFVLATAFQFSAFYEHGFANLRQTPSVWPANEVISAARNGQSIDIFRHAQIWGGLITTTGLAILQQKFYWFPLSPIGFVVACAIGRYIALPMMFVWVVKALALHLGGGQVYRSLRRVGLGLAFGHLAIASIWGMLGVFDLEATRLYRIGFW